MANGAKKYGAYNWRETGVQASIYFEAAMRHLLAWWDGEERAEDSGVKHLAHSAACLAIIFDADSIGKLIDDRPTPGAAAKLLAAQSVQQQPTEETWHGVPSPPPLPPFKPGNSQGCTLACHPDGRWGGVTGIGSCAHHLALAPEL